VEPAADAVGGVGTRSSHTTAAAAAAAAGEAPHSSGGRHRRGLSWGEKVGSWARSFGSPEPPLGSAADDGEANGSAGTLPQDSMHRRSLSHSS
jgi:hypothetical protein